MEGKIKKVIKKFAPILVEFCYNDEGRENKLNFFWIGGY